MRHLLILLSAVIIISCDSFDPSTGTTEFQAISLSGDSLFIPSLSAEAKERLKNNLNSAIAEFEKEQSEMNYIWLGRRWAYLGDYNKAISVYSEGLKAFQDSYKLYRHRGHRYVSTRQFDKAIADFEKAYALMPKGELETEPDGIPNRLNQPLSNTQFNILYHWGLAHYLKGDFQEAARIYTECLDYSKNDDLITATADWLYMSQRRSADLQGASKTLSLIEEDMNVIENSSYFKRLLMYKGELPIDSLFSTNDADAQLSLITQGYGVANWHLYNGDTTASVNILDEILKSDSWSPFGFIAAEKDRSILK